MRRMRPESIAYATPVRVAALWVLAYSAGAAVCALALPVLVLHAAATLNSELGQSTFAAFAGLTLAALLIRSAFLGASGRTLSRTALWLSHVLGAAVLTRGLNALRAPTDMSNDRAALTRVVSAVPHIAQITDALVLFVPLAALFLLAPVAGLVASAGAIASIVVMALGRSDLVHDLATADARRADADATWQTAAGSSVVIGARGLSAQSVAEWQGQDARAVARAFAAQRRHERICTVLVSLRHATLVAVFLAATLLASGSPAAACGAAVAALLLADSALTPLVALARDLPPLIVASRAFEALVRPDVASILTQPTVATAARPVAQAPLPYPRAEAS